MDHQPATGDGRGLYHGPVPRDRKSSRETSGDDFTPDDFLEANYSLAKEFYPELEERTFKDFWGGEFEFLASQGMKGQLQLNFPEISLNDLIEKYRDLTRRLKGFGEDVEGVRNYYPDYFTSELLSSADSETPDWATLIMENPDAGENDDPTLFGMGLPYGSKREADEYDDQSEPGTQCYESARLVRELKSARPKLDFLPGNARTRIIQSLLFMHARLAKKQDKSVTVKFRIKFWSVQLLLSGRSVGGWVPYIFLDGGGGACLGRDGGSGNSVYGFCLQAVKKR